MTLRIELQIVPFGDETKKYTIETVNISNLGFIDEIEGLCSYVIEHNSYKSFNEDTPRVEHSRKDGALYLAWLALKKIL